MGGSGDSCGGAAVVSYGQMRRDLDETGYRDVLPLEGLPLVQHLFFDLTKTTHSLQKAIKQYSYYKQIAQELETGVGPFKEENVRLIRENSHLRMAAVRAKEGAQDHIQSVRTRVEELEEEKVDLKLLVKQLSQRLQLLTYQRTDISGKAVQIQEKDKIYSLEKSALEQDMDFDCGLPAEYADPCPFCVRLRNLVEYGSGRDKTAADYFKITDARIEALQLQIRALKNAEKDMTQLVSTMKSKVESRDNEIEKLRQYITVRPGKDNGANGMKSSELISNNEFNKDLELQLKSAQMQLDLLQKRNINLEKKLKSSILQEHDDFMMGRTRTAAERELLRSLAALDVNSFPTHPEANLNEKLQNLEQQLSNCCKEKAALKDALEKCEERHKRDGSGGALMALMVREKSQEENSRQVLPSSDDVPSTGQEESGTDGSRRPSAAADNKPRDQRTSETLKSDRGLLHHKPMVTGAAPASNANTAPASIPPSSSSIRPIQGTKPAEPKLSDTVSHAETKSSVAASATNTMPRTAAFSNIGLDSKKSSRTSLPSEKHQSQSNKTISSTSKTVAGRRATSHPNFNRTNQISSSTAPPATIVDESDVEIASEPEGEESGSEDDDNLMQSGSMLEIAFMAPRNPSSSSIRPGAAISRTSKSEVDLNESLKKEQSSRNDGVISSKEKPTIKSKQGFGTPSNVNQATSESAGHISSQVRSEQASSIAMGQMSAGSSSDYYINSDGATSPENDSDRGRFDSDVGKEHGRREVHYFEVDTRTPFDKNGNAQQRDFLDPKSKQGESPKIPTKEQLSSKRVKEASQDRDRFKRSRSLRVEEEDAIEYRSTTEQHRHTPKEGDHRSNRERVDGQKDQTRESSSDSKSRQKSLPDKEQRRREKESPSSTRKVGRETEEDSKSLNEVNSEDDEIIFLKAVPGRCSKSDRTSDISKDSGGTPTTKKSRSHDKIRQEKKTDANFEHLELTEQQDKRDSDDPRTRKSSRDKERTRSRETPPGLGRLGRIDESDNSISRSPNRPPPTKRDSLEAEVSNLKQDLENKNAKLSSMNKECAHHLQELSRLKAALHSAEQGMLRSTSKESSFEHEMEIQRLKRQITNLQKDMELLSKEKDDAVNECRRLLREISVEKSKNENYKWSSQSLQQQFSTQTSRPQISQREELEMSRRIREQAVREQELEREIDRLKSNITALDRNKSEMRMELDHKDERLARMNQEFSKIQRTGRPLDYGVGPPIAGTSMSAREQDREVQYLKRQNESLRIDLETLRKERDEAVRDNRRVTLIKDTGIGSDMPSTDDIYKRTVMERSTGSQFPQRDQFEMSRRLRQQAAREHELDDEISRLRSSVGKLDRDKDEMRAELDRKDEKLARMNQDFEKQVAELSKLQLALKNTEYQLGHTGDTAREHEREVQMLKRQIESLRRDLESVNHERDETVKDCRRLAGAVSKEEIERRSLNVEYEKKSKEADELRKQVQKYIEEVRRIEDLLLQKEEEMETLIEHYRNLSLEKTSLETQRGTLEREATSIRGDVLETVDLNITLKNQLTSQNTLIVSYEEEIERLTLAVTSLESQLANVTDKDKSSESDLKAARDLIYTLEIKMDKLKLDLANAESSRLKLEAENQELKNHIELLEEQIQIQVEKEKKLQEFIASIREKEFEVERSTQDLASERDQLADRLKSMQNRSESLNEEISKFRLKSIELQNELDKTRRQLQSEKSERETAIAELRRVQDQLNNSSTNSLLNAALTLTQVSSPATSSGSDLGGASASRFTPAIDTVAPSSGGGGGGSGLNTSRSSNAPLPFSPMSESYLNSPVGASTARSMERSRDRDDDNP